MKIDNIKEKVTHYMSSLQSEVTAVCPLINTVSEAHICLSHKTRRKSLTHGQSHAVILKKKLM
jgi:hypothetical protein